MMLFKPFNPLGLSDNMLAGFEGPKGPSQPDDNITMTS